MAVALEAAVFRGLAARRVRMVLPYVDGLSALLLIAAGAYLVYCELTTGLVLAR